MQNDSGAEITIVGEVLYDCFPDGKQIPGGAPFNVAWNLKALGCSPRFISAVGMDGLGDALVKLSVDWGIDVNGLQRKENHATGIVKVSLNDGSHSFHIQEDAAYDHLELPEVSETDRGGILYHGSLVCRSAKSSETIQLLREQWLGPVFIDINIREPWFDLDRYRPLLTDVDYLKVNESEFEFLARQPLSREYALDGMKALMEQYGIRNLIVTCGSDGACWCDGRIVYQVDSDKTLNVADTVGAGDAFSAVCLKGIVEGWPIGKTLPYANAFAETICTLTGATTQDAAFYEAAQRDRF